jgi:GGDEF domain-containing protein
MHLPLKRPGFLDRVRRCPGSDIAPEHSATAVLYLDLHRFEVVKDCLGGDAADQLLEAGSSAFMGRSARRTE